MRISDWSSDVCSSDLLARPRAAVDDHLARLYGVDLLHPGESRRADLLYVPAPGGGGSALDRGRDRKSVVKGKSVSVRVDLGGRRIIKKNTNKTTRITHNDIKKVR